MIDIDKNFLKKNKDCQKKNKETLKQIKNYDRITYDCATLIIKKCTKHEEIQPFIKYFEQKNISVNELHKLWLKSYCISCKNHKSSIELSCSHTLCSDCFINIVSTATNNKFVLNIQESYSYPLLCPCGNSSITAEIIKKNLSNYEFYANESLKRLNFQCKSCHSVGQPTDFIVNCKHLCNECALYYLRNKWLYCNHCSTNFTRQNLIDLQSLQKKCEGCNKTLLSLKNFG